MFLLIVACILLGLAGITALVVGANKQDDLLIIFGGLCLVLCVCLSVPDFHNFFQLLTLL